ncbi:MAG: adventurous gliding motility protein GltC [Myxococcota bacterium]
MPRFLRLLAFVLCLGLALPASLAHAQMSFEGLDLGGSKKKKKKKKSTGASAKPDEEEEEEKDKTKDALLPAGGLDLTKPATDDKPAVAEDKKKGDKPGAGMSFDALDVSGKTAERQRLDAALAKFKAEQYEQSALESYELMQDPKMAPLHLEAQYNLAKALYRMGMYHSALGEFSALLAKGPNGNKHFKTSLEWLFFISHKTTNETVILDEIAKYANFEFPEKFKSEFRYLLARYHFVRGRALDLVDQKGEASKSFDEVRRLTLMIPRDDAFFPRAKYLEGLAYFREDKHQAAVDSMKEVVRVTRVPPGPVTPQVKQLQALRELAFMQLARTHYGADQPRYAIHYFGKVERGNTQWLESLFESSWASYRLGRYEQALGNLITLSSPFFRDEYFPEALILKAVIYYENCRYREALSIIEDFERIYGPVQEQLEALLQKHGDQDADYYSELAQIQKKNKESLQRIGTDIILERVLKLALTDQDLKKTNDSILELEGEIDSFGNKPDAFKYSGLAKELLEMLKVQRTALIGKAGTMTRGKVEFELGQIKQFRANALRIKFETNSKEKEFLERQLQAEGNKDIVRNYKHSVAVRDDELYWPYHGEYWRDELGTYQYTLTKGCIERESLSGSKGSTAAR